ncbi:small ribosomal subunit protein mS80 (rPPR6)-like [Ziziphus jujuba]|uniref:Small ribosomal subunit protein mS80 (RPPR6)-like n=1 Tax=Ziziphus jujuba TaxID=326968 RepID=A0ABM3IAV8_ZIZJJ|nr:small ribosomal subunit protein mS80 (rPPR6)-like [Ziziphus jujuba]
MSLVVAKFSKFGNGKAALEVFDKFGDFGIVANGDTYYLTIDALCRRFMFDSAWSVCQKMIDAQVLPDGDKVGEIISWLCKRGKAKDAHLLYTLVMVREQYPTCSSAALLIGSLSREDQTVKLALEMLDDFHEEAQIYAIKPTSAVIIGLCRMKDVEEAKNLLLKMIREGPRLLEMLLSIWSSVAMLKLGIRKRGLTGFTGAWNGKCYGDVKAGED